MNKTKKYQFLQGESSDSPSINSRPHPSLPYEKVAALIQKLRQKKGFPLKH